MEEEGGEGEGGIRVVYSTSTEYKYEREWMFSGRLDYILFSLESWKLDGERSLELEY